jgi:GNAT superfamily N-acetyltransferase
MELRAATVRDLDTLVSHRRRMWLDMAYTDARELDEADGVYRAWVRRHLAKGRLHGVVVVNGRGETVASGCVWLYEVHPRPGRPGPHEPYILSMYTEPAHRGRGHARRIVKHLLAWCRAKGFGAAFLHASDAGRSLYTRIGFAPTREMRLRWARKRPRRASSARGKGCTGASDPCG